MPQTRLTIRTQNLCLQNINKFRNWHDTIKFRNSGTAYKNHSFQTVEDAYRIFMKPISQKEVLNKTISSCFPKGQLPDYLKGPLPKKEVIEAKHYIAGLSSAHTHPSVEMFNDQLSKIYKNRDVKTRHGKRRRPNLLNSKLRKSRVFGSRHNSFAHKPAQTQKTMELRVNHTSISKRIKQKNSVGEFNEYADINQEAFYNH